MKKKTAKKVPKIPVFRTLDEEAKFWDTHSAADYWHQMKPINDSFVRPPSQGITVRFEQRVLSTIRQLATKKGLGATTLIRMWVLERLQSGQATA